jgi:hypothetical protein
LVTALSETADLLASVGEAGASASLKEIGERLAQGSAEARSAAARSVLRLYAGMGSFGDLVLQGPSGVRPEQAEFDRMRHRLFEAARDALR